MNKICRYFFGLLTFIMLPCVVFAKPEQPTLKYVEADLYTVTSKGDSKIVYFKVGQDIDHVDVYGAVSNSAYISVPNGNYNVWAEDANGNLSDPTLLNVTESCNNRSVVNATGSGTAERCFIVDSNKKLKETTSDTMVSCANGYYLEQGATAALFNDCERKTFTGYNLSFRYCKKTYQYKCAKMGTITNLKLATLSISTGDLTPSFSSTNYVYAAETDQASVAISATLQDNSNNFEKGYGPRTVELNYGLNNIYVKPKASNGSSVDYLIKITRKDTRDANNRLSSLSIDGVSISPSFNENTLTYNAKVDEGTNIVDVNAILSSSKASFVTNYGPRKVNLNMGNNKVQLKVRSESGAVRVYTINVVRGEVAPKPSQDPTPKPGGGGSEDEKEKEKEEEKHENDALLSNLSLSDGIITFDPNVFDYNVVVDYQTSKLEVNAEAFNSEDKIDIKNVDELEVGGFNEIIINVTSEDEKTTNTYTIYVERREENIVISNDSLLKDLKIDGFKIKFDAKTTEYTIRSKKSISELKIDATPNSDRANVTIEGNENLTNGSEIKIRVTAEDGSYTDYFIKVNISQKGGNVFLTIFVVILIILVLAYLVLRAMGYKIVFNFAAVVEIFKNMFSKKE